MILGNQIGTITLSSSDTCNIVDVDECHFWYYKILFLYFLGRPLDTQSCALILFTIIEDSVSQDPKFLKGSNSMEEPLPYKQKVGCSIPPCPSDIIISVKY